MTLIAEKKRYELRGFCLQGSGRKCRYRRIDTLTIHEDDPHWMAMELWRLVHEDKARGTSGWRYEVVDLAHAKGHLAPVVTYEELVRRTQARAGGSK